MWKNDHTKFEELAESCGNRYMAIQYVAKMSRKLGKTIPRYMLESKLLTWALTGERPPTRNLYRILYARNPDLRALNEYLMYVEDEEISSTVRYMYLRSVRSRHLVYDHEKELEENKLARARIILRMVWSDYNS